MEEREGRRVCSSKRLWKLGTGGPLSSFRGPTTHVNFSRESVHSTLCDEVLFGLFVICRVRSFYVNDGFDVDMGHYLIRKAQLFCFAK